MIWIIWIQESKSCLEVGTSIRPTGLFLDVSWKERPVHAPARPRSRATSPVDASCHSQEGSATSGNKEPEWRLANCVRWKLSRTMIKMAFD